MCINGRQTAIKNIYRFVRTLLLTLRKGWDQQRFGFFNRCLRIPQETKPFFLHIMRRMALKNIMTNKNDVKIGDVIKLWKKRKERNTSVKKKQYKRQINRVKVHKFQKNRSKVKKKSHGKLRRVGTPQKCQHWEEVRCTISRVLI